MKPETKTQKKQETRKPNRKALYATIGALSLIGGVAAEAQPIDHAISSGANEVANILSIPSHKQLEQDLIDSYDHNSQTTTTNSVAEVVPTLTVPPESAPVPPTNSPDKYGNSENTLPNPYN